MRVALLNDLSADDFSKQLLNVGNGHVSVDESSGTLYSFKSIDCVTNEEEGTNYPTEFLNSLDVLGLPPHNLQLKVGSVVIMPRNLYKPKLCNGKRLVIRKLMSNVIHASILKGKFKDEEVLIPTIPMIPTDMPFEFKRIQFPIHLAFAMMINKSQGQSLIICGLNLENTCFSHGQLYVYAHVSANHPHYLFLHLTKKRRMSFTTRCFNENPINKLIRVYPNVNNIVFNGFFLTCVWKT